MTGETKKDRNTWGRMKWNERNEVRLDERKGKREEKSKS
jgi:hypothetical protein